MLDTGLLSLEWLPPCLEPARPVGWPRGGLAGAAGYCFLPREKGLRGPGRGQGQLAMLPPGLVV